MLPTATSTPQGSGASGVLTTILTASLTATLNQGLNLENFEDDLAEELNQTARTMPIIYVDDSKITTASSSIHTNIHILAIAYQIVKDWMTKRGMKIDPTKHELIHHSW